MGEILRTAFGDSGGVESPKIFHFDVTYHSTRRKTSQTTRIPSIAAYQSTKHSFCTMFAGKAAWNNLRTLEPPSSSRPTPVTAEIGWLGKGCIRWQYHRNPERHVPDAQSRDEGLVPVDTTGQQGQRGGKPSVSLTGRVSCPQLVWPR